MHNSHDSGNPALDKGGEGEAYDLKCETAKASIEESFIQHFKTTGGEVWTLASGCAGCKSTKGPFSYCKQCRTAQFCNVSCQKQAWSSHRGECLKIAPFVRLQHDLMHVYRDDMRSTIAGCIQAIAQALIPKDIQIQAANIEVSSKVQKTAQMMGYASVALIPDWFTRVDLKELVKSEQELEQRLIELYSYLRDIPSWKRDHESFPASSYTLCLSEENTRLVENDLAWAIHIMMQQNLHLSLFSAWLQDPQAPAILAMPFEQRGLFGLLDSILQIAVVHDAIDRFMESRH